MKDNDILEKTERYLRGELKGEEYKLFEKQMETDSELAQKVELFKSAIKGIELSERAELKNTMKNIHKDYIASQQQQLSKYNLMLKIAAVFVGLLLISSPFIYNYFSENITTDKLFAANFQPYPDLISQRSETISNTMLLEAMSYYKNGEFENASVLFSELLKNQYKSDTLIMLYNAIGFLGAHHPEEAILQFDKLIIHQNSFSENAKWYKILALIETEQIEEAEKLCISIIDSRSYNFIEAEKLMRELKKLK